ncbi:MAG: hypothetical protein JRG96_14340 [Deltaproteobacteria bacterium]|nr:hypothetical protein [Deltaproteobacteria bacterium]MBW2416926.1 hypothetical protein [Deltaproteobacteria bacterium]
MSALRASSASTARRALLGSPAVGALAVFLLAFAFQLPFFDRWFSTMDEGHLLAFADIVAKGGHMYRDATIYPLPGAFYMLALAFKAFGASIILSRWIVMLEFSLFVALVYLLLRRIVPMGWAGAGVVMILLYRIWAFPHWQIYSYSTTALLFLVGSMLCMLSFFDRAGPGLDRAGSGRLALSGFLFGMGVLCKQDYGAAMLLAGLATLAVYVRVVPAEARPAAPKLFLWWIVPGAMVGAAMAAYFAWYGVFGDLFQQTVLGHMRGLTEFEYAEVPPLFPLFGQDPFLRSSDGIFVYWPGVVFTLDLEALRASTLFQQTAIFDFLLKLFFHGPKLLLALGALHLYRGRGSLQSPEEGRRWLGEFLLFSLSAGLLLVLTVNRPQDYLHFAVVYWCFLCLCVVYCASFLRGRGALFRGRGALLQGRRALALGLALLMAVPAAATLAYSARLAGRLRSLHTDLIPGERGGIYAKPSEARLIEGVVEYARENSEPGEVVSVIPYFPIVQFLMDRPGPHRSSYIVWPFPEFADRDQRIIRAMEEQQVELVIYNFTQFNNFPRMSEFSPDLYGYVAENYRVDEVFTYDYLGYRLLGLKRVREPAPGRAILSRVEEVSDLRIEYSMAPSRPVAPGERSHYLIEDLWPFRPTVALRPTADGGRTVFSIELEVPEGARLETALAVNPRAWFDHPSYTTSFGIALVEADGARSELFQRVLAVHTDFADRGWTPVSLSLAEHGGRTVVLEFSTSTQLPQGESLWNGGWELPRLVVEEGGV